MAGARNSLTWTESDALAEAVSAESCHIVLDTSPPDYVEKIARYLESSVGQNGQDQVSDEADSDSGDSLFITQTAVPEAERTRRRHRSLRSGPKSPRDLEGSGSDASSSDSHGESKTVRERKRRRKCKLPKYCFSFISGRKGKPNSSLLPLQQNISLHNYTMGGFFKCVREQWLLGCERKDDETPTVDMDGEDISPLSEKEEGRSEDEDIKVVERKCFLASKAKHQQSWSNQLKQEKNTKKAVNAKRETSRGTQHEMLHKTPDKASKSRVPLLPCGDLVEKLRDGEHGASCEMTKGRLSQGNKKIPLQQKAREEDAVCESHKPQRSPRLSLKKHREASTTATEPQSDVLHTYNLSQRGQTEDEPDSLDLFQSLPDVLSDTNNDSETTVKKRKKKKKDKGDHESVEEEKKGHSWEEPEGLHAAASVDVEVGETPSLSEDNRAEPLASQASDELEFDERNCLENSSHVDMTVRQEEGDNSKQKKKKRKKSAAENVSKEADGNLELDVRVEDSGFSESWNVENGGQKKKKKKRKRSDEEQLQPRADAELLSDDTEIKKKRKNEKMIVVPDECEEEEEEEASNRTLESGNCLENTAAPEEMLESSNLKRKKHKKKKEQSNNGENDVDMSFCNDAAALEESTDKSLKKNKKKKKQTVSEDVDIFHAPVGNEKVERKDDSQQTKQGLEDQNAEPVTKKKKKKKKKTNPEEVDISHTPEENEMVEDNTQKIKEALEGQNAEPKKKRKKKKSEIFGRNISEDSVAQSDESVSVRKKEKKKKRTSSFLAADAEEKGAQTHGEQKTLDFETESAEISGNLGESNDGVRKKKKKRKRKMSEEQDSVEKDFEEPKETCQSALPEPTETGVKRKKKRKGNESELERVEISGDCPADEAVVLKKKKKKSKDETRHVILESPPTATEDTESETPGNQVLNDIKEKKKKKKH